MGFGNLFKKRQADFTKEEIACIGEIYAYYTRLGFDPKVRSRIQAVGLPSISSIQWSSLQSRLGTPDRLTASDYSYIKKLVTFGTGECAVRMKFLAPMLSMPEYAEQYGNLSKLDSQGKKILEKLWFV